jgi:hypothetical protein
MRRDDVDRLGRGENLLLELFGFTNRVELRNDNDIERPDLQRKGRVRRPGALLRRRERGGAFPLTILLKRRRSAQYLAAPQTVPQAWGGPSGLFIVPFLSR